MLNFHIRKVILKSGDTRYRTVITKSGKGIKSKTFRRKADAKTWGSRTILEHQENEAKGINPCTVTFSLNDDIGKSGFTEFELRLNDGAHTIWCNEDFGFLGGCRSILAGNTPKLVLEQLVFIL